MDQSWPLNDANPLPTWSTQFAELGLEKTSLSSNPKAQNADVQELLIYRPLLSCNIICHAGLCIILTLVIVSMDN